MAETPETLCDKCGFVYAMCLCRLPAVDATTAAPTPCIYPKCAAVPCDANECELYEKSGPHCTQCPGCVHASPPAAASPVVDASEKLKDQELDERASAAAPATVTLSGVEAKYAKALQQIGLIADGDASTNDPYGALQKMSLLAWTALDQIRPSISDTPRDDPPRAEDATPLDATDRARKDWRFIHEAIVSDENRRDVETLTDDIGVAMARTRASLEILGRKGSAGIWLENESLLAVRRVLEEVVDLRGEVSSLTGALEEARRISQLAIAYRDADTRFQNAVNARDPMGADDATDLGDVTRTALFDAIDDAAAARSPETPE